MKKLAAVLIAVVCLFSFNISSAKADTVVSARSAIVIEKITGRVLYEKNAFEKLPMASTTKIMTAVLTLENCRLNDIVVVGKNASGVEGSSIWLSAGEKLKVSDLLFGLMLASGNDAAVALAEHIAGTVADFTALMNAKAKEIGAYNTSFANPNGLPAADHYTTAYDLAIISAYAMRLPYFCEVVKTQYKTIPWEGHEWDRVVKNKNRILWQYEGGNGVKTGWTKEAGHCLVAAASRENMQLISVVLNAPGKFEDSMNMFDIAFDEYDNTCILEEGEHISDVSVLKGMEDGFSVYTGESVYYPMTAEEAASLQRRVYVEKEIIAPVSQGQDIGFVDIWMGDTKIYSYMLKAPKTIGENSYKYNIKKIFGFWLNESFE